MGTRIFHFLVSEVRGNCRCVNMMQKDVQFACFYCPFQVFTLHLFAHEITCKTYSHPKSIKLNWGLQAYTHFFLLSKHGLWVLFRTVSMRRL